MPFGSQRSHSGTNTSDYRFTDQELDAENGLYNYNARLYDPFIGRFISPDMIVPDPYNPQSLNRYTYCLNNPLIYIDPSGHYELTFSDWLMGYRIEDGELVFPETVVNGTMTFSLFGLLGGQAFWEQQSAILDAIEANQQMLDQNTPQEGNTGGSGGTGSGPSDSKPNKPEDKKTPGEQALEKAYELKGKYGIRCDELVEYGFNGKGFKTGNIASFNIASSPYFKLVTGSPQRGDVENWLGKKGGHMGFYDPDTKKENKLDANLFHSPGENSEHPVGFEDSQYVDKYYKTTPKFYRYIGN
jgi:RHS repeat-associated protein